MVWSKVYLLKLNLKRETSATIGATADILKLKRWLAQAVCLLPLLASAYENSSFLLAVLAVAFIIHFWSLKLFDGNFKVIGSGAVRAAIIYLNDRVGLLRCMAHSCPHFFMLYLSFHIQYLSQNSFHNTLIRHLKIGDQNQDLFSIHWSLAHSQGTKFTAFYFGLWKKVTSPSWLLASPSKGSIV